MTRKSSRSARPISAALAISCLLPSAVIAQTPPPSAPVMAPTAAPMPLSTGSPLPYPAYGTPAPDISQRVQKPGVPVSVTLEQSVDIAVAQSPLFASERAQYRAIQAKYGSEQSALFPAVSGAASVNRSYGGLNSRTTTTGAATPPPTTSSTGPYTTLNGTVTLTQLIFDGGRTIAGIRTAKESDIAGRETLIRQLQTLANTVAIAYYTLLEDNATVSADASLVREFEVQENYISAEIRTGAAPRSDLAAAQFQTAQARGQLIAAQSFVIQEQSTFATTLGLDADTMIEPKMVTGTTLKTLSYQDSLKEALTMRPDYVAAEHTVESSKENLRFAKLARFPLLDGTASTGVIEETPYTTRLTNQSALGATLTIPIFDQGLTNYNVAVAASQLDQANAGLVSMQLSVQANVRSTLSALVSSRAALVQAQAELQSAQVTLQATQAQYRVGASTITAIVTADANLATAQTADIAAIYNERIAEENYTFALGTSDLSLK